ncbi:MAG: MFS transporter, partial [Thermoplasmatales archaeon]
QFRRRTSMLWILWFTTGFAFYGFFTFAPTLLVSRGYSIITSLGISLLGYVMQAPGYYLAAIISEKIGRKALLSTYMLVGAAVAISLAYSSTYLEIVVFYALMSFFLNGLFGGVYIYTPEQYPTDFRTSGMGYASSFARIGSIMSPILFGVLLASIHFSGVFTMSFLVMLVGAASVLILGQETTSKDLEKTSAAVSN